MIMKKIEDLLFYFGSFYEPILAVFFKMTVNGLIGENLLGQLQFFGKALLKSNFECFKHISVYPLFLLVKK